ncbi:MAG: hypothetical protein H6712_27885 [Myxococcales bacterium]|nr:hypothetical protein [Myxococcales bacterium]MCB9717701.1 hypothetical protein [Myxococcales bacterium]
MRPAPPSTRLHLLQHQIHHRGRVHAMLAGSSARPPQLDELFMAEEHPRPARPLSNTTEATGRTRSAGPW